MPLAENSTRMEMDRVHSSMIRAVGYEPSRRVLEVAFGNGSVYRYEGVPLDVYLALMAAPSKGHYMRSEVIPAYEARNITAEHSSNARFP